MSEGVARRAHGTTSRQRPRTDKGVVHGLQNVPLGARVLELPAAQQHLLTQRLHRVHGAAVRPRPLHREEHFAEAGSAREGVSTAVCGGRARAQRPHLPLPTTLSSWKSSMPTFLLIAIGEPDGAAAAAALAAGDAAEDAASALVEGGSAPRADLPPRLDAELPIRG